MQQRFLFLFVALLLVVDLSAQTPPSNLQLLGCIVDSLLDSISVRLEADSSDLYLHRLDRDNKLNWFFETRLVDKFSTPERSVYLDGGKQTSEPNRAKIRFDVEYRPVLAMVGYQELLHGKTIQRIGRIEFFLLMTEGPAKRLLWSGTLSASRQDVINRDAVKLAENRNVDFSVGQAVNEDKSVKLFPPLLVSGVAGLIVYLFYSIRSR